MKEYAVRLERGADLKLSIEMICRENGFDTAVVLSGVGCVYHAKFRRDKATAFFEKEEDYEIVSLNGTVSKGKAHIHIALADDSGATIGGHLMEGCLINTTCELVIAELPGVRFGVEEDSETGYKELIFQAAL